MFRRVCSGGIGARSSVSDEGKVEVVQATCVANQVAGVQVQAPRVVRHARGLCRLDSEALEHRVGVNVQGGCAAVAGEHCASVADYVQRVADVDLLCHVLPLFQAHAVPWPAQMECMSWCRPCAKPTLTETQSHRRESAPKVFSVEHRLKDGMEVGNASVQCGIRMRAVPASWRRMQEMTAYLLAAMAPCRESYCRMCSRVVAVERWRGREAV